MSVIREGIHPVDTGSSHPPLRAVDSALPNPSLGRKGKPAQLNRDRPIAVHDRQMGLGEIENNIASLNSLAFSIRLADSRMSEIETYLDRMREQLGKIVKNYPPFPPGSEERAELLRSFTSLRRQIEQLTIPPNDPIFSPIPAEAQNRPTELGENGMVIPIPGQQLQSAPTGFNLPDLPEMATDEQIGEAIIGIDKAKATLEQERNRLAAESMRFLQRQPLIAGYGADLEELDADAAPEAAIETKNAEVKEALADVTIEGLTQAHSQLLLLLR